MKLGTKITIAAVGSVLICSLVGILVQRHSIRTQGIKLIKESMRATILQAEDIRDSVSMLNKNNAFASDRLLDEMKKSGDFRKSTLYGTIPVVAAWQSIQKIAESEKYEFRIPKKQARNSKNEPTKDEEDILNLFESKGVEEYFQIDKKNNKIIFARPIRLTADCLACHGDPAQSPTKDGKDVLGFKYENWKAGEVHGAFILKADLNRVDKVVWSGVFSTLVWLIPITILIAAGFTLINHLLVEKPLLAAVSQINTASDETTSAAQQISTTSQSLAEGSSEQAASLQETSASLEELSSMTSRNAESASSAKTIAAEASNSADSGAKAMKDMKAAMSDIKTSSSEIANIISTIDAIAFQTNILALNAAVEAARAGDAGMGFAVVADEVRNLAQRSAVAAKETAQKIESAVQKTTDGVEQTERVGKILEDIIEKVKKVDALVVEIAQASKEQNDGIQQINQAVAKLDQVTQTNAASAEESAAASEQLQAQANLLKQSIHDLVVLIGASESASSKHLLDT